jgi:hypothetical protein
MYIVYGAQNLLRNDFRAWYLSKVVEHVLSLLEMKLSYSFIDSYIGIASHTRFQNTALRSPKKIEWNEISDKKWWSVYNL